MNGLDILALSASALVGLGIYGLLAARHLLRRVLAFNLVGSGLFLWFGAAGARGGVGVDPIPQALIITGIVVALAASALGVALVVAHARLSGPTLPEEAAPDPEPDNRA
ncbi:MAG: NADH-quinone oxidoreductase subunit K [Erythrobacter sp.]